MGNFFTSAHIYNKYALSRSEFINSFCKAMKKDGYVICDSDESELDYIFRFSDNCKWVAVTSDSYGEDESLAVKDFYRIVSMAKAPGFCVTVIDSDLAGIDIYTEKFERIDTVFIGNAEATLLYAEIPQLNENAWKPFLADGRSLEQVYEIIKDINCCVEERISRLAPIIDMDEDIILFHADIAEDDENTLFLDFKKDPDRKTLTLNAGFKKVFGSELEKIGFVKVKSRYPYYVRVVNNEILHVITYVEEECIYPQKKSFRVFGGVATIYRPTINFSVSPKMNYNWLRDTQFVYYYLSSDYEDFEYSNNSDMQFYCSVEYDEMLADMREAFDIVNNTLIYALDKYVDIDACLYNNRLIGINTCIYDDMDFGKNESAYDENEGLLYILAKQRELLVQEYNDHINTFKKEFEEGQPTAHISYEEELKHIERIHCKEIDYYDKIFSSPELYSKVINELEHRAENNRIRLRKYGLKI